MTEENGVRKITPRAVLAFGVLVGSGTAALTAVLQVVLDVSPGMIEISLLVALLLAVPVGAISGMLVCGVGLLIWRMARGRNLPRTLSAGGAGFGVFLVGLGITAVVVGAMPDVMSLVWLPIVAVILSSFGLFVWCFRRA